MGIDVIERDDLCEWFGGGWEAKDFEQIFDEHPEALDLFRTQHPPGTSRPGRDRRGLRTRACVAAVEAIMAEHREGDLSCSPTAA